MTAPVPAWSRDIARTADALFHEKVARLEVEDSSPAARQPQPSSSLQLRVVTWNCQLLEGVLPGQAGSGAHLRARAAVIAARLLELGRGGAIDVVVLQEAGTSRPLYTRSFVFSLARSTQ